MSPLTTESDSISESSFSLNLGNECDQQCNVIELNHIPSERSIRIDQSKFSGENSIYIADQVALLTHFGMQSAAPNKGCFGW